MTLMALPVNDGNESPRVVIPSLFREEFVPKRDMIYLCKEECQPRQRIKG